MNTNTKILSICVVFLTTLILLAGVGCARKSTAPVVLFMPERIINDFSDMSEHEIVSWAWIRRGFVLSNCRAVAVEPVTDSAQNPTNPTVLKLIEQDLNAILNERIYQNGELDLIVQTNVLNSKTKLGRVRSWFANFDRFPYIEIEILITERSTGLPLVKIIHFSRDKKSLPNAVTNILDDLKLFLTTAI
jgi:hypothetical protein